jgi:hypothetical protein
MVLYMGNENEDEGVCYQGTSKAGTVIRTCFYGAKKVVTFIVTTATKSGIKTVEYVYEYPMKKKKQ